MPRARQPKPSTDPKARARRIVRELERLYPEAVCALVHESPFQLLVATILSAQCTDARVNMVTPALFRRFPDARAWRRPTGGARGADPLDRLLPGQGEEPQAMAEHLAEHTTARSPATSTH